MSNPMVGDIVSYHPGPTHPLAGRYGDQPLAAIVVSASEDGSVNLCIFDPDGAVSHSAAVRPRQEGKKHHGGSFEVRGASKPAAKHDSLGSTTGSLGAAGPTPPVTPYQEGVQARRDQVGGVGNQGGVGGAAPSPSYQQNPLGYVQGQIDHPPATPTQSYPPATPPSHPYPEPTPSPVTVKPQLTP